MIVLCWEINELSPKVNRKMKNSERKKVYIYTRVSTAMQIDGCSLDAQKTRMKSFADFNNYEIVGEYEDAGKSGKRYSTLSLDKFREKYRARIGDCYVIHPGNLVLKEGITCIPPYMAICL